MKEEIKPKPCPCGNQRIAQSFGSYNVFMFCPECGRYVETQNLPKALESWNAGQHKKDVERFVITQ